MPFLRVIRDKRGYETTYLMHWYREGNKQRSRILYVFRTPGHVRVGRSPLEPDVLRAIQAEHPDIEFDWKTVLGNQQVIESAAEPRRPHKRRRTEEGGEAAASPPPAPPQPAPLPRVPAAIEGETDEEKIEFLRAWYERIRERIAQRTLEPEREAALLSLAERINPASWTDPELVRAGLQDAAEALERLSKVFSKRRRRRKSRPDPGPDSTSEPPVPAPPNE